MTNKMLQGKNCVVTGGARGIGLTYALRLADLGGNVAVSDVNLSSALEYEEERRRLVDDSLLDTLEARGVRALVHEHDSSDDSGVAEFAQYVNDAWGHVDVLVANAGGGSDIYGSAPTSLVSDKVQATFEMNLFSVMRTCAAFAPLMYGRENASIVTIASFAGTRAMVPPRATDYGVAKAGVAHYTRYLAAELAPEGVRVNALAPGFIASGQWKARFAHGDEGELAAYAKMVPMGRLGTPDDCANVVEFLVSPLSEYVTGQIIPVDGGMVLFPS